MTAHSKAYTNSTSTKGEGMKKTAECQMILCTLLAWPSRKKVLKLRTLPRRCWKEIINHQCCMKQNHRQH